MPISPRTSTMKRCKPSDARTVLLPQGAGPARVIVCERTGRWAAALRSVSVSRANRIHETRSLPECWEVLAGAPASLVVVELTPANLANLLTRLQRLNRDYPLARAVVVTDRRLADGARSTEHDRSASWRWLAYEAGAIHFTCSPREMPVVADIARRHLAQAPHGKKNVVEAIWDRLPWRPTTTTY